MDLKTPKTPITLIAFAALTIAVLMPFILSGCTPHSSKAALDLYAEPWELSGDLGAHDPAIAREGGKWYVYYTGIGIRSKSSADGRVWEDGPSLIANLPTWVKDYVPTSSRNFWAPDIARVKVAGKDRWALFYSVSTFGKNRSVIGLATNETLDAASKTYAWKDEGPIISSRQGDDYNAIDPAYVEDEEGRPYLVFGSFWDGIRLVALDKTTLKPAADAELLPLARRDGVGAIEAPFIVRRGEWYYLFVSFDFCCKKTESDYKIAYGRANKIEGPYVDKSGVPMLEGGGTILDSGDERRKGPGHCAVYQSGDQAILVNHFYDAENLGNATLQIRPLRFDEAGWPEL